MSEAECTRVDALLTTPDDEDALPPLGGGEVGGGGWASASASLVGRPLSGMTGARLGTGFLPTPDEVQALVNIDRWGWLCRGEGSPAWQG
jgi:hypothetical protein